MENNRSCIAWQHAALSLLFLLNAFVASAYTWDEINQSVIINWFPHNRSQENSTSQRIGIYTGGITIDTAKYKLPDSSAYFDGSSFNPLIFGGGEDPFDIILNTMLNATVCFWTNITGGVTQHITGRRGAVINSGDWWIYYNVGDELLLSLRSGEPANAEWTSASATLAGSHFNLLCGVINYTGGVGYAYVILNNTVKAEASTPLTTISSTKPLYIGDVDGNGRLYAVTIDDYLLINKSLSTDDISTHIWNNGIGKRMAGVPPAPPPPATSCVYSGLGAWFVDPAEGCILNATALGGNNLFINSSSGAQTPETTINGVISNLGNIFTQGTATNIVRVVQQIGKYT